MNDSKTTFRIGGGWILGLAGIALFFFGLGILALIQWHQRTLSTCFFGLCAVCLGLARHALKVPLFVFSPHGFSYRRFLFSPLKYLPFDVIQTVHPTEYDHRVSLILTDGSREHLSLYALSGKDRIRLIFLLESDVNRKHIG